MRKTHRRLAVLASATLLALALAAPARAAGERSCRGHDSSIIQSVLSWFASAFDLSGDNGAIVP